MRFQYLAGADRADPRARIGENCPNVTSPLSMHAATYNTFNLCRHLTTARTHRRFRAEAIAAWRDAASVAA